ncbi:MAG TPA: aspartate--tRNA ligase [Candidatus Saccharimonadales bacterium]|nr:aspartate--tRNA ligase [Candidatus Saccharimonadales bacterium]
MKRVTAIEAAQAVGQTVLLQGWVHARRDHGKLIFIDLRDLSGIMQVVFWGKGDEQLFKMADSLRSEFVVSITGTIQERQPNQVNPDLPTGQVELAAEKLEILNESQTPPFEIADANAPEAGEEIRLKYRYLDLRRQKMQRNLRLRSQFVQKCRQFLFDNDFAEIETPILTESTPEGSRDFVVPSRLNPGSFYALPQSPQQYKQLLMIGGFERYFQIARAIRDEDPRADRGFEHTQVDIEMSFVDQNDVMNMVEAMMIQAVESLGYNVKEKPFPRFTYAEAMEKFGADKFDLRTEAEKKDPKLLAYAWVYKFPFFEKSDDGGWTFTHNPFSMPVPEHVDDLLAGKNIENILTTQYDLICNGYESGGGSIRAHKPEILKAVYKVMGFNDEQIKERVGHMLEAFQYGAPPHGGIALGVERNLMNLTGEEYLREVQAFPMTGKGQTAVMKGPKPLTDAQLKELGIKIIERG